MGVVCDCPGLLRLGDERAPDSVMTTETFGESRPLVETADGVREPQNRRVEITFGPSSGFYSKKVSRCSSDTPCQNGQPVHWAGSPFFALPTSSDLDWHFEALRVGIGLV